MTGFTAFTVSETVGNSSSSKLHSTCGGLLIALSLIDDGRLRTLPKCSAHLFKIASVSQKTSSICTETWGGS